MNYKTKSGKENECTAQKPVYKAEYTVWVIFLGLWQWGTFTGVCKQLTTQL